MGMYIGIDIGGTKCSVVYGNDRAEILEKRRFKTTSFKETTDWILESVSSFMDNDVESIGISCGGPLDSRRGLIISPPNLPDWNNYPITEILGDRYGVPVFLQNDADACAVAEWRFGAGRGCENMVFLTFGTGMGAGLILNSRLYRGTNDGAGEIGHVRLYESGHVGYRKAGSIEGYCSGAGIAQYGMGSARILGRLAREGDENAIALFKKIGEDFGKEIAILIDILNPQLIVVGSIYRHCAEFMEDSMWNKIEDEAIKRNVQSVKVVKAQLGEQLGDVAALCVAMHDYL
ncbi:MAG: ROK family protein [Lachnospiraceae bacterium]|nr:ROK family protein [Lachnospiraceae bacterium]MDE6963439.1 ROK family protein [Lachnospiraceae bacterium]